MSALLAELPVIDRARMMRELAASENAAVKDKSYQASPIGQEVRLFLQALRFEGAPQTTRDSYEVPLSRFSVRFADFESLHDFCNLSGVAYIRDFLNWYWGESSTETKRQRLAAVRSFFNWGVGERGLPFNPAARIKSPRAKSTIRIAHARAEMRRLVDAQESLRDRCALQLFIRLGARKNDIRMLRIRDIDLTREVVHLRHRKGGDELMLPIGYPELRDDLYLHIQGERRERGEFLLYPKNERTRPMDQASVHRWFKRCLAAAGITDFPLHELRHTAGDEMWRTTGNIVMAQQLLGHKSLETTRRYLHPSEVDLRTAMRAVADDWAEE